MRACAACGNDRDLEPLGGGWVLCPVCSQVTQPVVVAVQASKGGTRC